MALTERTSDPPDLGTPAAGVPRGFRPASRRRSRIAAGVVLAAVGVGGNVLLYTSLDDTTEVLQVVRNVPAGEQVTSADLRIVEVELDPSVPAVTAADIGLVIDHYARVYIPSGTLMSDVLVQSTPLVSPGLSVVAVELRASQLPSGLVERSRVMLVVTVAGAATPTVVEGRIVGGVRGSADAGEARALSVEVNEADAPVVAASDDVRVVLLDPANDPAMEVAGG